jgi:2-polyprenyl-3-methyl-5-hydroxy-6-metoxy-1,4-benzoquinol methylase
MKPLTECPACSAVSAAAAEVLCAPVSAGEVRLRCVLVRCTACRHVFMNPQAQPAELAAFYDENYHVFKDRPLSSAEIERFIATHFDGELLNHAAFVPGGKFLDVGCGLGDMVAAMQAAGMNAHGIDPSPRAVQVARQAGRSVELGDLCDRRYADCEFDSISMYHSLEHTAQPLLMLRECARILKPAGQLTVAVPNIEALNAELFGREWSHLSLPYHLQHFTKRSLERVARRAGLRCTHIATESLVSSIDVELCRWFRRHLLVPYRLSRRLGVFQPFARYLAGRGQRADRGEAIVARFGVAQRSRKTAPSMADAPTACPST